MTSMHTCFFKPVACGASLACLVAALAPGLYAGKFNRVLSVGDEAPAWQDLEGTDGCRHALADLAEARLVVLVFTNHRCPVARGYDARLVELQTDFAEAGVQLVAIESGGPPDEIPAKMRSRAQQAGYNFAYVHDPTLNVCRAYGATCTPTVFLLVPRPANDKHKVRFTVAYQGAIDDSPDDSRVRRRYLRQAIDALLAGHEPQVPETRPTGCEISDSQPENPNQPEGKGSGTDGP